MKYSNMFITGSDSNTEWQLPWFIENYYQHNDIPLRIVVFGLSDKMKTRFQDRI